MSLQSSILMQVNFHLAVETLTRPTNLESVLFVTVVLTPALLHQGAQPMNATLSEITYQKLVSA